MYAALADRLPRPATWVVTPLSRTRAHRRGDLRRRLSGRRTAASSPA